jgi:flavin reductase (DIM6/NTAB) family NADH-FMN oxidoreductase RutF
LEKAPSELVKPYRVAESPVQLECVYARAVELESDEENDPNTVVFGKVVGVHIDDRFIVDGLVDTVGMEPIGRLGYLDYVKVGARFSMQRPQWE